MALDWWSFYKTTFYTRFKPPVLFRNLQLRDYVLNASVSLAATGIGFVEDPSENPQFADLIEYAQENPTSTLSDDPDPCCPLPRTLQRFALRAVKRQPKQSTVVKGVLELRVRDSDGRMIRWNTVKCEFAISGHDIYLLSHVDIAGPEGALNFEFELAVPSYDISAQCTQVHSQTFDLGKWRLHADAVVASFDEPVALKYYIGEELVEVVEGFTCPFSRKTFASMETLLKYHSAFHPNLVFGLHPLEKYALCVYPVYPQGSEPEINTKTDLHYYSDIADEIYGNEFSLLMLTEMGVEVDVER